MPMQKDSLSGIEELQKHFGSNPAEENKQYMLQTLVSDDLSCSDIESMQRF